MESRIYSRRKSSHFVFFVTLYLLTCDLWIDVYAKRKDLHIGGIFPINGTGGWQGGQVKTCNIPTYKSIIKYIKVGLIMNIIDT